LTWNRVDLVNSFITLSATETKDAEPRRIPIPDPLHKILSKIPKAIHDNHVFLYRGKPISDIRKGLTKACEKAGIPYGRYKKNGFVFHDLRHTFNTNMRKAGVPESVIMKITGHSTREMFDRYNTVDDTDANDATTKLEVFLASVDQNVDQSQKPKEKGIQLNR
jgi:integrase